MNPVLKYSVLRIGIFAVLLVIFWLLHMMSLVTIVVAAVLAFLISFLALRHARRDMIDYLEERRRRRSDKTRAPRRDADENYEDALLDDELPAPGGNVPGGGSAEG